MLETEAKYGADFADKARAVSRAGRWAMALGITAEGEGKYGPEFADKARARYRGRGGVR